VHDSRAKTIGAVISDCICETAIIRSAGVTTLGRRRHVIAITRNSYCGNSCRQHHEPHHGVIPKLNLISHLGNIYRIINRSAGREVPLRTPRRHVETIHNE